VRGTVTVVAEGLSNPFRLTWSNATSATTGVFVTDTASAQSGFEQTISGPIAPTTFTPINYGYPCFQVRGCAGRTL
jgi:hypothetical protein